jgi:hypothetical protein
MPQWPDSKAFPLHNKDIHEVMPSWVPLSPPLCSLILCFGVIRKVSGHGTKRAPNWEYPGWDFQIQHINFFSFDSWAAHLRAYTILWGLGGAKVMLAVGYGYPLFDFVIDYCYGFWFWLLLMAIGYGYPLLAIVDCYRLLLWLLINLTFNF